MDTSKIFGDKSKFAIYYRTCPDENNDAAANKMVICLLVIDGNLIGKSDEECYLPTWFGRLTRLRNRLVDTKHSLFPKELMGLSDREIFETLLKANQLEKDFHPDFLHLPQIDSQFWSGHLLTLDETIDDYLVYFYVKDNRIIFLIEDESGSFESNCRSYKFIFHSIDFDFFISTVDFATVFFLQRYPYLKQYLISRTFNPNPDFLTT